MVKFIFFIFLYIFIKLQSYSFANDCGPYFENFTAPVCTDARYFFLIGSGVTYAAYRSKSTYTEQVRFDISKKNPLGDYAKAGEVIGWGGINALYIGYQFIKGKYNDDPENIQNAELATDALAYTSLATLLIKMSVRAQRPDRSGFDSFPSGHSSSAFSWASIVMARHEWYYGVAAYALSSFVSLSRINDSKHHFHDVYGGITLGISYGWGIYYNYTRYAKKYWFTVLPTENLDGMGLNVSFNF